MNNWKCIFSKSNSFLFFVTCFIIMPSEPVFPLQKDSQSLPNNGIAAKYPGDIDIENDPDVIFVAQFEQPTLTEVFKDWEDIKDRDIMSLSQDKPPKSPGKASIAMTHIGGNGTGGHLWTRFPKGNGLGGYDQLYLRYYVKFSVDHYAIHHMAGLGGYYDSPPWPMGHAGERPVGNDRFSCKIEPYGEKWNWDFYNYWMEMHGNPTSIPDSGANGINYWGNSFNPNPEVETERGTWICVETMCKLNTPVTQRNGEAAFWVDGVKKHHLGEGIPPGHWVWDKFITTPGDSAGFEGFKWRCDERLKINILGISIYITTAPNGYKSTVWFDHLVVAKKYIGPLTDTNNIVTPPNNNLLYPKATLACYFLSTNNQVRISYSLPRHAPNSHLTMYNVHGSPVKSRKLSSKVGTVLLDSSTLTNGNYYITLESESLRVLRKIIIVR